jgi:hypothetical protein
LRNLAGKVVIDCTNPLAPDLGGLTIGHLDSAGEAVGRWAMGAKVIKALNTTGSGTMLNPRYGSESLSMFVCGDDADAKKLVTGLVAELGFEPVDAGELTQARYLEPLAMLWISMAYKYGNGPNFGSASCAGRSADLDCTIGAKTLAHVRGERSAPVTAKFSRRATLCLPAFHAEASRRTCPASRKSRTECACHHHPAAMREDFSREWLRRAPKRCRNSSFWPYRISNLNEMLREAECETECSTFYRTEYIGARRSAVNTMIDGAIAAAKEGFEVCTGKRSMLRIARVQTRHVELRIFVRNRTPGKNPWAAHDRRNVVAPPLQMPHACRPFHRVETEPGPREKHDFLLKASKLDELVQEDFAAPSKTVGVDVVAGGGLQRTSSGCHRIAPGARKSNPRATSH